jgi:hypothetical protein
VIAFKIHLDMSIICVRKARKHASSG